LSVSSTLTAIEQRFHTLPPPDKRTTTSPVKFISGLVASVSKDGRVRSVASLRRGVIALTGIRMNRKTFWERLSAKRLQSLLSFLITGLMKELGQRFGITDEFLAVLQVKAVLLLDSTSSTLPKGARKIFPGARKNVAPAALKFHCLFDLFGGTMKWFDLTEGKRHDRKGFPPLEMLKGCLIIFDLGYWDYCLLAALKAQGSFFLSRIKSNAIITVVEVVRGLPKHRFEGRHLFGRRMPKRKWRIIEVIGEFRHYGKPVLTARVIGFWNPIEKRYHWYVTNLAVAAQLIYPLYRLRWQMELVFKACKSSLSLADYTSANENIIRSLTLASLIGKLISFALGKNTIADMEPLKQAAFSFQRAATLMTHIAHDLFQFITTQCKKYRNQILTKLENLANELYDPNYRKRDSSLRRVLNLAANAW
jgi:putative transposase